MKSKHYMLALIPISLIGLLLRAFQVKNGVEPDTLFLIDGVALNWIFPLFTVLALLLFLSGLLLLKPEKKPLDRVMVRVNKPERILMLIYATLTLTADLYGFYKDSIDNTSSLSVWRSLCALLVLTFVSAYVTAPKTFGKNNIFKLLSLSLTVYYSV